MANEQVLTENKRGYGDIVYALFRVILGVILLVKGLTFIFNTQHLMMLIQESRFSFTSVSILAYYISFAHLFGGVFIILGLLTRISIVLQLPVIVAAVIFNLESEAFGTGAELALSLIALVLIIFYLIKGPGKISMDHYRRKHKL